MKRQISLWLIALVIALSPLILELWELPTARVKLLHAIAALFTIHVALVPAICGAIAAAGIMVILAAFVWESK